MFSRIDLSRARLAGVNSHTRSFSWSNDARHAGASRTFRPVFFAAGTAAILGAIVLGALGPDHDTSSSSADAPRADVLELALPSARLIVAGAAADSPGTTVIPRSSVAIVDGKPIVFVAEPDLHLFVATPVELGERAGSGQRVTRGLVAGQRVAMGDLSILESRLP